MGTDITAMAMSAFRKALAGEDTISFPGGVCVCMEDDEVRLPEPFSIIYDGDLTAVTWDDGSVTRTHRQDNDEYDPLFGTLACIVRKLTDNKGHGVDLYENEICMASEFIEEEDDVDYLIDHYTLLVNMLKVLRNSKAKWLPQLGPDDDDERASDDVTNAADSQAVSEPSRTELEERIEQLAREREAMRQRIRDLIDAGEL